MLETYVPILLAFLVAAGMGSILVAVNALLAPRRPTAVKAEPYECGIPSEGSLGSRFSVRFFLTAVLFLLFDVEVVFLFPWAVSFQDFLAAGQGPYILGTMLFFLFLLEIALVYVIKKGALTWE